MMHTQRASRLDLTENQNSMLALTQMALLGGNPEWEILLKVKNEASLPNVKAYVQWLLGDDAALERISPSSLPWYKNIAKFSALKCLISAGFGTDNQCFLMPEGDLLEKFIRIGMWPTRFEELDSYSYDLIHSSQDPIDNQNSSFINRYKPSSGFVILSLFLQNEHLLYELTLSEDAHSKSVLNSLDEKSRTRINRNCQFWYSHAKQRKFRPTGDELVLFLINWAKIFGVSYDFAERMSEGVRFTDDQLIKLIYGGYHLFAHELGKRMVRLPRDLRYFDQLPEGVERNKEADEERHRIRSCWARGTMEGAAEFLDHHLPAFLGDGSNISTGGFLEQGEINYFVQSFGKLAYFIDNALKFFLKERRIRIYSKQDPLKWSMILREDEVLSAQYMDAAEFVTQYLALQKRYQPKA